MKKKNRKMITRACISFAFAIFIFGFASPYLISSEDDILVWTGISLVCGCIWFFAVFNKSLFKEIAKVLKK